MRKKILVSLSPDVLAVIDARAKRHCMSRSAYIAVAALGLLDDASDNKRSTKRTKP